MDTVKCVFEVGGGHWDLSNLCISYSGTARSFGAQNSNHNGKP